MSCRVRVPFGTGKIERNRLRTGLAAVNANGGSAVNSEASFPQARNHCLRVNSQREALEPDEHSLGPRVPRALPFSISAPGCKNEVNSRASTDFGILPR
jgi:hypothetical protein